MNQFPNQQGTPPNVIPPGGSPGEGKATGALVCGILSFICAPVIASIIGIILALGAKKEGYVGSKAQIGLILCIISLVLAIISTIIFSIIGFAFLREIFSWF